MEGNGSNEKLVFILGDVLPTVYDVAVSIYSIACKPNSQKMNESIAAYTESLINLWIKAFGENHVLKKKAVKERVQSIVTHYYNNVYAEQNRTKPKKKNVVFVRKSLRQLNREWSDKSLAITKKQLVKIDSLFDIGVQMSDLKGDEKKFYDNLTGARLRGYRLSQEVDMEYVSEKEAEEEERRMKVEREEAEALHSNCDNDDDDVDMADIDCSFTSDILDASMNRSGLKRVVTSDIAIQHNSDISRSKLRLIRKCTFDVKAACVALSVNCMISTEMARIAFQTVCSKYYGHKYYLSTEEAIENEPSLINLRHIDMEQEQEQQQQLPPPKKNPKGSSNKRKVPTSKEDYKVYEYVIPSARTLNDHKQAMAIKHERDAALALYDIPQGIKVTLHFDTTSRSKIDGDWPSLIFIFSDKRRFNLRPLFFAYEDRAQIVRLIVETYSRLSATITNEFSSATPRNLWEKTTALMTDSVEKNLKISEGTAEKLNSEHIPLHLLCKSHPVEGFDRSNLAVLAEIEKGVDFRATLESINPAVRSFLRGKSIVECAISSILSLVSHEKSASSTNQADLFDHILERENVVKHMAMYYERRFTKLGYSAASILEALPYLRMLLDETHLNNQHVEIVRMFLDSEFLLTELNVLAYFTHKITLPFLYFVEVNTQDDLLAMFPLLFQDLLEGKMDTLKDYTVEYTHVRVNKPTESIAANILSMMCTDAANVLERQAGREYGFGKYVDEPARATKLYLLTPEDRAGLPTNNLDSERNLTVFGKRAPLAKFRNKKFTAKGIRNDCTLHQTKTFESLPFSSFPTIVKHLNDMEKNWTAEQKVLHTNKILEKIEKGKQQSVYTDKCLQQCKEWGGPAVSVEELNEILRKNSDKAEQIVRIELSYYRDTHKQEIISNPHLFKLNKIRYEEQLVNLCTLLAGKKVGSKFVSLPTNKDVARVLPAIIGKGETPTPSEEEDKIEVGEMYITLISEAGVNTWYLATCLNFDDAKDYFEMEFLHRVDSSKNLKWKNPTRKDIDHLFKGSILSCVIDGQWDVSAQRNMTFTLRNHEYIEQIIMDLD